MKIIESEFNGKELNDGTSMFLTGIEENISGSTSLIRHPSGTNDKRRCLHPTSLLDKKNPFCFDRDSNRSSSDHLRYESNGKFVRWKCRSFGRKRTEQAVSVRCWDQCAFFFDRSIERNSTEQSKSFDHWETDTSRRDIQMERNKRSTDQILEYRHHDYTRTRLSTN